MSLLADLALATDAFDRRAAAVKEDQWTEATPCTAWCVLDLVHHVIEGNRVAVALLAGAAAADAKRAAAAGTGTGTGPDVLSELRRSADEQVRAFATDDAFHRVCHHARGDIPGSAVVVDRIGDLTVHTWDLARAIGGDERLDPRLVELTWAAYLARADALVASGHFGDGPSGTVDERRPLQARLLDLVGRRP